MSQAIKTLKTIAAGEEYKSLVEAIEKADYPTVCNAYTQLLKLIEEADKATQQRIQGLARRNKEEDFQKFRTAFNLRIKTLLPRWYELKAELDKQKIREGAVFGVGTKGDPLARTAEGRVVVIRGATLKEGDKVRFKVVAEGEKIDFARLCELGPDLFYSVFSQGTRDTIRSCINSVREKLFALPAQIDESCLNELNECLKNLEQVKQLAGKLQADEKEKTLSTARAYRNRLFETVVAKLAFDTISHEEEMEIRQTCGENGKADFALAAPGIFRRQSHDKLKAEIMAGAEPRGYAEVVQRMEKDLDSMSSALALMEFKAGVEKNYPAVQRYVERIDRLYWQLTQRARELASRLAESDIADITQIISAVKDSFSKENVCLELRRVFRSSEEFTSLRGALLELSTQLGNMENAQAETAIKPYLRQKIALAFNSRR